MRRRRRAESVASIRQAMAAPLGVALVATILCAPAEGMAATVDPPRKSATAVRAHRPVVLDGHLGDPGWRLPGAFTNGADLSH